MVVSHPTSGDRPEIWRRLRTVIEDAGYGSRDRVGLEHVVATPLWGALERASLAVITP